MESDVRPPKSLAVMEDKFENYDVFISHRGPDTKTGFVGFLYEGLVAVGLRPFLDCKSIDKGQDTWKCINHAIKTTPIALVIFSESFAQSEWCLKELHVMLGTPSVKVLPIFYKVQPCEVSFPDKGLLAAGFKKLKQRHDEILIEHWRADLSKASKLNGWEQKVADQRMEKDLVTEVVGKLFELANKPLPLHVGDYIVGVKQVAEEIIRTLDDKKKVLMLGLWGMGGIGKSTLARELYNRLGKRFAASCYVEDVTDKVNQGGVVQVQNCILNDLCMHGLKQIEDKSKGKIILEERLCKKQILVVLDDVHDNDEMDYWITRKMLTEGSMCIVTSRNRRVFEKSNSFHVNREIYIHDVQLLSSEDSMQMFTSYAFGRDYKVKQGLEKLVANVSMACGGVPLVLKVCGALLREEENVDIWEEVTKKLNCGAIMDENKIFECLRISYDALQQQQQEMFLDIACALLGQSEDLAVRVWNSLNWSPALGVRCLKEKALISVDCLGRFTMHDHLRDMGREIVRKRRESEGVCRRLWMPESITLMRKDQLLPDSLQTLIFNDDVYMKMSDLDLSHMKELRILICSGISRTVKAVPENLRWFNVDYSYDLNIFSPAPKNNKLVILIIDDDRNSPDSFESINEKVYLRDLQVLRYKNSGNSGMSLGDEILQSKDLEVLDLSGCLNLDKLPEELGSLKNLSSICLDYCSVLKVLPNSLGQLTKLKKLSLIRCEQLFADGNSTSTSTIISKIKSLCDLNLQDSDIRSFSESFGMLSNLEVLNLQDSYIRSLPESFWMLSNLEVLNLMESKLITLPDLFGNLRNLRDLNLCYSDIASLPESFGQLSNLTVLNMNHCRKLKMLPDSFGGLKNLRDLDLADSGIVSLPKSFGGANNLEVLDLSGCSKLISLPDLFGSLENLWNLNFAHSPIESLPESFGKLSNLEVLDMRFCENLVMLPDSFGSLRNLRTLNLGMTRIESLPEAFGELSNLQHLNLCGCSLNALPQSFTQLWNLQTLDLLDCPASQSFKSV